MDVHRFCSLIVKVLKIFFVKINKKIWKPFKAKLMKVFWNFTMPLYVTNNKIQNINVSKHVTPNICLTALEKTWFIFLEPKRFHNSLPNYINVFSPRQNTWIRYFYITVSDMDEIMTPKRCRVLWECDIQKGEYYTSISRGLGEEFNISAYATAPMIKVRCFH